MAEKEQKFFVLLMKDIDKYLTKQDKATLRLIARTIEAGRREDGKPVHKYICCGQHEPYADKVWKLILEGEAAKEAGTKREG